MIFCCGGCVASACGPKEEPQRAADAEEQTPAKTHPRCGTSSTADLALLRFALPLTLPSLFGTTLLT